MHLFWSKWCTACTFCENGYESLWDKGFGRFRKGEERIGAALGPLNFPITTPFRKTNLDNKMLSYIELGMHV